MFQSGLSLLKKLVVPASLFMLLAVTGCSSENGSVTTQSPQQGTGGIELPVGINVANLPANGSLHAFMSVDNGTRQELNIDLNSQTVSGSVGGITPGNHTFLLQIIFIYDTGTEVTLAHASSTMEVTAGSNNLAFSATDYVTSYDSDGDGVSNLTEINTGTNPTDPVDTECVLGTSRLGSCVLG